MATARVAIRDWEQTFCNWSKPSRDTEAERQANAERMICDAVKGYAPLKSRGIVIIPQGSYRNSTNVRRESDVDVCVSCTDTFFYDLAFADYAKGDAGIVSAVYTYAQFKNDVQAALEVKFGKAGVKRGDKAFDVHENSYRVYADVVAAFPYRMYTKKVPNVFLGGYEMGYLLPTGTAFITDGGVLIQNWPEQHYSNGVEKNKRTGKRFKSVVRGLKNLRCEMEEKGVAEARPISSYLIECLAYNVPDALFAGDSYYFRARQCLCHIYASTKTDEGCKDWLEINGVKYLFFWKQPWRRDDVQSFVLAAWRCGAFS